MREIKFRAWDAAATQVYTGPTDSRRMSFYGSDFTMDDSQNTLCFMTPEDKNPPIGDYGSMIRYTLMQYTGLKDKNGKDCYEGDKIIPDGSEITRVVEFRDGCFTQSNSFPTTPLPKVFEIIGNIYENER